MRFIKTEIEDHKDKSYIDIDKAFKFSIVLAKNSKYRIRAYFLTSQKIMKGNMIFPVYAEIREFENKKEAILFMKKLLGNWLKGVE